MRLQKLKTGLERRIRLEHLNVVGSRNLQGHHCAASIVTLECLLCLGLLRSLRLVARRVAPPVLHWFLLLVARLKLLRDLGPPLRPALFTTMGLRGEALGIESFGAALTKFIALALLSRTSFEAAREFLAV